VAFAPRLSFDQVRAGINPDWIEEALVATGTASIRRRRLPAEQVVWLVLGIALERNRRISEVVETLGLALPDPKREGRCLSKGSISQARVRLGEEPMRYLFELCARHWALDSASKHLWHGLQLFAIDGTTLRVPDSTENREAFGAPNGYRSMGSYPLVRLATLMAVRSHLLLGARFGPYSNAEPKLAAELWPQTPQGSLLLVDRGFFGANVLMPIELSGRHWLTRAKAGLKWRVVEDLGAEGMIVEMDVSRDARRLDPSLPCVWRMRTVPYCRPGFRPQLLLSSLVDPTKYPAEELVALYHERWEIELGFNEVKTEMMEREESLRSKSPMLVEQEIWGLLSIYNLVRLEMERAAELAQVPPNRISFVLSLHLIQDEWRWASIAEGPGALPKKLQRLRENLARLVLPERRRDRCYPRAVKLKLSPYPRKRSPSCPLK